MLLSNAENLQTDLLNVVRYCPSDTMALSLGTVRCERDHSRILIPLDYVANNEQLMVSSILYKGSSLQDRTGSVRFTSVFAGV